MPDETKVTVDRSFEEGKDSSDGVEDVVGVDNCPAECPTCQQTCSYTAGHAGLHHCGNGHEWI